MFSRLHLTLRQSHQFQFASDPRGAPAMRWSTTAHVWRTLERRLMTAADADSGLPSTVGCNFNFNFENVNMKKRTFFAPQVQNSGGKSIFSGGRRQDPWIGPWPVWGRNVAQINWSNWKTKVRFSSNSLKRPWRILSRACAGERVNNSWIVATRNFSIRTALQLQLSLPAAHSFLLSFHIRSNPTLVKRNKACVLKRAWAWASWTQTELHRDACQGASAKLPRQTRAVCAWWARTLVFISTAISEK